MIISLNLLLQNYFCRGEVVAKKEINLNFFKICFTTLLGIYVY